MSAVLVDVDSLRLLCVDVAGNMISPVDDKAVLADAVRLMGKYCSRDAGADD